MEGALYISNYRLYLSKTAPTEAAAIPPALSQNTVRDENVLLTWVEQLNAKTFSTSTFTARTLVHLGKHHHFK